MELSCGEKNVFYYDTNSLVISWLMPQSVVDMNNDFILKHTSEYFYPEAEFNKSFRFNSYGPYPNEYD